MDKHSIIGEITRFAQEQLVQNFIPGKTYIQPAAPYLDAQDVTRLAEVVLQFWYTEWKYCRKFEQELEKITHRKHVALVNSGSSASLLAITAALRLFDPGHNGRYILTCATGFPTTVSPIIQNGYTPIYVDILDDLTPNLIQIKQALHEYGRDIVGGVFAHTLGMPYDELLVKDMLGEDRFLVSDCCDAAGATIHGEPVGTFADFSTLSFFPSHHMMAGEGGAVMCDNDDHAKLVTSLSNWGRSCYCRPGESNTCGKRFCWDGPSGSLPEGWDHKYVFSELGYNLKMTEFQGALGYSQALKLPELVARRRQNYAYLYRELNRTEYHPHISLIEPSLAASPFGFPIIVSGDEFSLTELIAYLEDHKVGTRRLFGGNLVRQPGIGRYAYLSVSPSFPVSDYLMNNLCWISVSPSLNTSMLNYMVYVVDSFFVEKGLV